MYNGLITSLSLYPIKYLNEFFVPYDSSLETNILSTSMPSIFVTFCFYKSLFLIFFISKIYVFFYSFLYLVKKKEKFLYNKLRCTEGDHILYLGSKLIFRHSGL